ncbi:hypothetical protein L3Y34_001160 [Caenorhabditis briggsae]|uniref:Uncharacterized protein n=1 Tax=Caenorhabditis briggsae TaxID=6238 RepID=A0AAE9DBJ6_CAEBR|nr:hypothetical protein L3Y34_001160 [Caenorhabditis briggsae]
MYFSFLQFAFTFLIYLYTVNYIRDYHLDIRTGSLESCKNRKTCENHLSWKDVKIFREKCRAENKNPDDFEPADLIGLAPK